MFHFPSASTGYTVGNIRDIKILGKSESALFFEQYSVTIFTIFFQMPSVSVRVAFSRTVSKLKRA